MRQAVPRRSGWRVTSRRDQLQPVLFDTSCTARWLVFAQRHLPGPVDRRHCDRRSGWLQRVIESTGMILAAVDTDEDNKITTLSVLEASCPIAIHRVKPGAEIG